MNSLHYARTERRTAYSACARVTVEATLRNNAPVEGKGPEEARACAYYEIAKRNLTDPSQPSGTYLSVIAQQNLPVNPGSDSPQGPVPGRFLTLGLVLSHPLSFGSVHLKSDGPSARCDAGSGRLRGLLSISFNEGDCARTSRFNIC
ncbi:hypothetical protein RRF57_007376 [Xylaria bambusicola]|uniref:Uncharacterized protein n=1 Tax=Xylaria bambusicola TaxID=326684 RepID=A0AAN7UMN8_9PEZI